MSEFNFVSAGCLLMYTLSQAPIFSTHGIYQYLQIVGAHFMAHSTICLAIIEFVDFRVNLIAPSASFICSQNLVVTNWPGRYIPLNILHKRFYKYHSYHLLYSGPFLQKADILLGIFYLILPVLCRTFSMCFVYAVTSLKRGRLVCLDGLMSIGGCTMQ